MRFRWFHAVVLLALFPLIGAAAPAVPAGKTSGPPITFQFAPGDSLMGSVEAIVRTAAGDNIAKMVKDQIKDKLGEKGFAGLDMKKPIAGCMYLPNKAIEDAEDLKQLYGYLAIPTTGPEDLQGLIERLVPHDPLIFKPVDGKAGLYTITSKGGDADDIPVFGRYHEGYFYMGFNVKEDQMKPESLTPVASMLKSNETSLMSLRTHVDRFPPKVLETNTDKLNKQLDELRDQIGMTSWAEGLILSYAAYANRANQQWKQVDEYTIRLIHDTKAEEIVFENILVPKKGTALATETAATQASTNAFANLITDTTAAGMLLQLPITTPELRDLIQKGVEAGEKNLSEAPEYVQPILKELLKGFGRTAKANSIDIALAVNPTKKDEPFQGVLAISFEDATGIEKAIKESVKHKDAPETFKNVFKFDVDKIDGVNVHKLVSPDNETPEPIKQLFGGDDIHVAFGPKGIYVAVGPDPIGALKTVLTAKPAPAKAMDIVINPKRLGDAIVTANAGFGAIARGVLGSEDKRLSAMYFTMQGGSTMTVRMGMSIKVLPKMMGSSFALRGIAGN